MRDANAQLVHKIFDAEKLVADNTNIVPVPFGHFAVIIPTSCMAIRGCNITRSAENASQCKQRGIGRPDYVLSGERNSVTDLWYRLHTVKTSPAYTSHFPSQRYRLRRRTEPTFLVLSFVTRGQSQARADSYPQSSRSYRLLLLDHL